MGILSNVRRTVEDVLPGNVGKDYSTKAENKRKNNDSEAKKQRKLSPKQKGLLRDAYSDIQDIGRMSGNHHGNVIDMQRKATDAKNKLTTAFPWLGSF